MGQEINIRKLKSTKLMKMIKIIDIKKLQKACSFYFFSIIAISLWIKRPATLEISLTLFIPI